MLGVVCVHRKFQLFCLNIRRVRAFRRFYDVFSIERRVTHTIELIFNSKNVINPNINWSVVSVHRIFELLK